MSGKKMASIIITILIVASLAVASAMLIFFKTYDPKPTQQDIKEDKKTTSYVEYLNIA